ncbi:MAG: hypothetical protein CM1200mP4_0880 [Rhodospirillaceae bacterium]|nr:MAG: hypothetical protein CM1200mP4_0880 [Rhodospirillaceae bacterium]
MSGFKEFVQDIKEGGFRARTCHPYTKGLIEEFVKRWNLEVRVWGKGKGNFGS